MAKHSVYSVFIIVNLIHTTLCRQITFAQSGNPVSLEQHVPPICNNTDKSSHSSSFERAQQFSYIETNSRHHYSRRVLEHILAQNYDALDEEDNRLIDNDTSHIIIPPTTESIAVLRTRGAHRCWHKHSTFLEHLLGVHNILRLWGEPRSIGHVGLFHSAYSNSYVNLALFDPNTERELMKHLIGAEAEELVHLFCIIDRQDVVVNNLLRHKIIPKDGLFVPHLKRSNEQVFLSAETLRMLIVFTMADTADQYFGWQDQLFGGGGEEGSMIIPGEDILERHHARALWPGVSKPGLWMSYVSQLAQVVRTYDHTADEDLESNHVSTHLKVPSIFNDCKETLSVQDELIARDLYWNVVMDEIQNDDQIIATLQQCATKNPWAFEPFVLLAQKQLHAGEFIAAANSANRALELQHQWGTAWDKRLGFGAWVAWTRVLLQRAQDKNAWPTNSWDVNNLGLVQ